MATEISPLDEDRMLKEAISNTEAELFRNAVDLADPQESDGEADRSQEEMGDGLEGQVEKDEPEEAEGDEPEAEGEEEGDEAERDDKGQFKAKEPEVAKEEQPKGRVPVAELLTERKARQAAEDALKTERESSRAALDAMNARLDSILMAQQRPQEKPAEVKSEKPDMFAEPEKYEQWLRNDIASGFTRQRVESSLADAHETHGESFVKAYQELTGINIVNASDRSVAGLNRQDPIVQATINRIMQAPNPGRELMRWHQQETMTRMINASGGIDKFREQIGLEEREKLRKDPEYRKQTLAELRAEASGANGGQVRNVVRIPKSLSDVAGGSSANRHDGMSLSDSDADVFADTWKTG